MKDRERQRRKNERKREQRMQNSCFGGVLSTCHIPTHPLPMFFSFNNSAEGKQEMISVTFSCLLNPFRLIPIWFGNFHLVTRYFVISNIHLKQ